MLLNRISLDRIDITHGLPDIAERGIHGVDNRRKSRRLQYSRSQPRTYRDAP